MAALVWNDSIDKGGGVSLRILGVAANGLVGQRHSDINSQSTQGLHQLTGITTRLKVHLLLVVSLVPRLEDALDSSITAFNVQRDDVVDVNPGCQQIRSRSFTGQDVVWIVWVVSCRRGCVQTKASGSIAMQSPHALGPATSAPHPALHPIASTVLIYVYMPGVGVTTTTTSFSART